MNTLSKHPYPATFILSLLGLALFLFSTNPHEVAIGLLVVPVALFFLAAFSLCHMVLERFRLISRNLQKRRIVALVSAALITTIGILQSTGGLSGADFILLALIVVVAAIYIEKY